MFAELSEGQREPRRSSARSKGQPRPVLGGVFCPLGPLGGGGQSSPGRPGAEGGVLPAPRLPAHTQAADGGGGWLCQTHTHTHTRQRLQLSSPSQDVSAVHDCSHFSTLASKPHCEHKTRTQPLSRRRSRAHDRLSRAGASGGAQGGTGGSARLGSARHGSARLAQVRPGGARHGAGHWEATKPKAAALPFSLHSALQTSEQPVCC